MTDPWLAIALAAPAGPKLGTALERLGDAAALAAASPATLTAAGLSERAARAIARPDPAQLAAAEAWLATGAGELVRWADPDYPALLRELADAPPVLFLRGRREVLGLPQLAIVGSRNPSADGRANAHHFATALAGSGFTVTSGLARGIDAAAHRGALAAGGVTIAVCATGPDRVYPDVHSELAAAIAATGAVIGEYPPGTPPRAHHFPRRNRLISGLAVGTLVVEAAMRSGALITARLAAEQGREVFAIPGSIHNPVARGCHRLIRDGAGLVETTADIVAELGGLMGSLAVSVAPIQQNASGGLAADPAYARLLEAMGFGAVSVDELGARVGLTTAELSSMLIRLELAQLVDPQAGGRYRRSRQGFPDE